MPWPEFMDFYTSLSPEQLETLVKSVTDPAFHPGLRPTEGREDPAHAEREAAVAGMIAESALAIATHLLHAYHDWLGKHLQP
ncbi:MAG: hypothetical protein OWU84_00690 [Firmicutes bacterium]|nr:hypothetical protein [Bacillota bacterium]